MNFTPKTFFFKSVKLLACQIKIGKTIHLAYKTLCPGDIVPNGAKWRWKGNRRAVVFSTALPNPY